MTETPNNSLSFVTAEKHITRTSTDRRGANNNYGRRGGNFRESEAHCSCGWSSTYNGQTYVESQQEIREHLKEMGVYNTQLEQTVYAHITPQNWTAMQIAVSAQKTVGRVQKVLDKLVERGNVYEPQPGTYQRTDKWFSWND